MKKEATLPLKFDKTDTLAVKGIAIILMIQHHNFLSADRFENYIVAFTPFPQSFIVTLSSFMKICVGMYVFLSGYGLALSLKKYSPDYKLSRPQYKDYFLRRTFKLMAGFWLIYILGFVINLIYDGRPISLYFSKGIARGIFDMAVDISGLAYLFGTPTLNGTWWYMTLALFIILVIPFAARLMKRYGTALPLLLVIFIPRIISFGVQMEPDAKANISRWFFAAVLGVVCAEYDLLARAKGFMITKNKVLSKFIKFAVLTGLLVGLYFARVYLHKQGRSGMAYELTDNIIPAYVVYYCYEFITGIPVLRQVLAFVGKHSMNIFLLHTFVRLYILADFVYSFRHFALITLAVLLISLAISVVLELLKKYLGFYKLVSFVDKKIAEKAAAGA